MRTPLNRLLALACIFFYPGALYAAQCDVSVSNEWGSGFTAAVTIDNTGQDTLQGWAVSLAFADGSAISNIWNADLSGSGPYEATNKSYNGKIEPGSQRNFGFNVQKATAGQPAVLPSLGGICETSSDNASPVAVISLSPESGEVPLTVTYDASNSTDPNDLPLEFEWRFDDGSTSSEQKVERTYTEPGEFSVWLAVSNGTESTQAKASVSALAPQPDAIACSFRIANEWNSGFTGEVAITNDADFPVDGWTVLMTFPDGTQLTGVWNGKMSGENPYLIENANYNGDIAVGESVKFGFNAQKPSQGLAVEVPQLAGICRGVIAPNEAPTAFASVQPTSGTAPLTIVADGSGSSDPDGDPLAYSWSVSGQQIATGVEAQYTFDEPGDYTVRLTVSDGELDSEAEPILVRVSEITEPGSYSLSESESSLFFVSTKKTHVVETHTFDGMSGEIDADGQAIVSLDLTSVNTGIDIRNARMQEYLFETTSFPIAKVTLDVDMQTLTAIPVGSHLEQTITPLLDLHGFVVPISTEVRIRKLSDNRIMVQNLSPVIVNAEQFGLVAGVDMLRSLAGLDVISYLVPVNFTLIFVTE